MSPPVFIPALLIFVGLPVVHGPLYGFHRFFRFREKKLEVEAGMAAEKAAQYAAHPPSSSNACGFSSRSLPTEARRPQPKLKRCASRAIPAGEKTQ